MKFLCCGQSVDVEAGGQGASGWHCCRRNRVGGVAPAFRTPPSGNNEDAAPAPRPSRPEPTDRHKLSRAKKVFIMLVFPFSAAMIIIFIMINSRK